MSFRLRVGDYRVRFYLDGDTVRVLRVRNRREAYHEPWAKLVTRLAQIAGVELVEDVQQFFEVGVDLHGFPGLPSP